MIHDLKKSDNRIYKNIFALICILLAATLMSYNIKSFVRAGNLIPGGISGLSLLLQRVFDKFFSLSVPYSVINISLNAVPAFIGFKTIGKRFTIFSVLMIVLCRKIDPNCFINVMSSKDIDGRFYARPIE